MRDVKWSDLTTDEIRMLRILDDPKVKQILINRLRNDTRLVSAVSDEDTEKSMNNIIEKAKYILNIKLIVDVDDDKKSVIGQLSAKILR